MSLFGPSLQTQGSAASAPSRHRGVPSSSDSRRPETPDTTPRGEQGARPCLHRRGTLRLAAPSEGNQPPLRPACQASSEKTPGPRAYLTTSYHRDKKKPRTSRERQRRPGADSSKRQAPPGTAAAAPSQSAAQPCGPPARPATVGRGPGRQRPRAAVPTWAAGT